MGNSSRADILAASSAGGHFDQLMLLRSAFEDHTVLFATTDLSQAAHYGIIDCIELVDANQNTLFDLLRSLWQTRKIVKGIRPKIVISTGAAPGLFCLLHGKLFGAYTIWVDSVANAEKMSLSGRIATGFCDEVLTQHDKLANSRIVYQGRVI